MDIVRIRVGVYLVDKQGLIFNYTLFGTLTGSLINFFSLNAEGFLLELFQKKEGFLKVFIELFN